MINAHNGNYADRQYDHADRFVQFEVVLKEQVEDQHRAEHVEHDTPQTAGIDVQCFSQGKPCSPNEQDGQDVVGKSGGKDGE